MQLTDTARVVLEARYLQPDETPKMLFHRVAKAVAAPDDGRFADDYYGMMTRLEFLPNSPTLMNAGTGQGTLSACFVLPLHDTMKSIAEASKTQALVQKFGGGTGFSLSEIRSKGAPISTTHGKACGPIAVLKYLSATSTLVTQGGKRDGANMAVMNVDHPDIREFIYCKSEEGDIHNFNISVGATDAFMERVSRSEQKALDLFREITANAWANGEPGMIFLDQVNRKHPAHEEGTITSTNPCGEQPLLPNESCNLGSINLSKFVIPDSPRGFDYKKLNFVVKRATRFLDNVISINQYATPEIEEMTKRTRKIGIGVMGWADALSMLGIPYTDHRAIVLGRRVMKFIAAKAKEESELLAVQKGGWGDSAHPQRNACLTTIAPTGSISMIAGCSSGIEPHFALSFTKQNVLEGKSFQFVNEHLIEMAFPFVTEEVLRSHLAEGKPLKDLEALPLEICDAFPVSGDIQYYHHIWMQSAFQEHVDSGVSKTINLPNSATSNDVFEAYLLAWSMGCKGITVYRQGSRDKEVLTSQTAATAESRPETVWGATTCLPTGRGKIYMTLNRGKDGKPFEIFINHGKAGGNDSAMAEALARIMSVAFKKGASEDDIAYQLRGISDMPVFAKGKKVLSVPDAIAQSLNSTRLKSEQIQDSVEYCPECQGLGMVQEEGCEKCHLCGYSVC